MMRRQKFLTHITIISNFLSGGLSFSQCSRFISQRQNFCLLYSCSPSLETLTYQIMKEDHILSPPNRLTSLELNESITPFSWYPELTITRVSLDPNIFILRNFLSAPEHQASLIMAALQKGMEYSGTSSGDVVSQRLKSYTSWIYPDEEREEMKDGGEAARFMTGLSAVLFQPENILFDSSTVGWEAEAVQVVRYEKGGKYDVHHDGYNRFLTVLTYLNGIAGTWFPYAVVDQDEYYTKVKQFSYDDIPDVTMDNVANDKVKGEDGLFIVGLEYDPDEYGTLEKNNHIVKVNPGDAVAFYSYDWIDSYNIGDFENLVLDVDSPPPTGPLMNFRSLHTGTTAKDEKWIATNWFRLVNK